MGDEIALKNLNHKVEFYSRRVKRSRPISCLQGVSHRFKCAFHITYTYPLGFPPSVTYICCQILAAWCITSPGAKWGKFTFIFLVLLSHPFVQRVVQILLTYIYFYIINPLLCVVIFFLRVVLFELEEYIYIIFI